MKRSARSAFRQRLWSSLGLSVLLLSTATLVFLGCDKLAVPPAETTQKKLLAAIAAVRRGEESKIHLEEPALTDEDLAALEKDYEEVGIETAEGEGEEEGYGDEF